MLRNVLSMSAVTLKFSSFWEPPLTAIPNPLRVIALALVLLLPEAALAQEHGAHPPIEETKERIAPDSSAAATEKTGREAADPPDKDLLPASVTTQHSVEIAGKSLNYAAKAGSIALRNAQGKTAAAIFYVAYTADPTDGKRPITFVFNGGPGAASAYLHLGGIGPKVIDVTATGEILGPPPRLKDNGSTWLDTTDLVFVDPVGTGYSQVGEGKDEKDYYGVEQDTDALADFIRLYLIEAGRMASPVFLMGESYGAFRAATITRKLQSSGGISPNGLLLISPALDFALLNLEDYNPLAWALDLPSLAAVNLESKGVTEREALRTALKEVEEYALSDYLAALASGAGQGGKQASETVSRLTGLPLELVEKHRARISPSLFIKQFDRKGGRVLSRYDGSVSGPDPHPTSEWPRGPDPVLDSTVPLWTSAFVEYAQNDLGFKTDKPYRLLNREVRQKWDFGTTPTRQGYADVLDDIQEARATNPSLEVMIASGYTDLITPYLVPTFVVNQFAPLEGATPITIENYAGGHMLYLRPDSRQALKDDAAALYGRALRSS